MSPTIVQMNNITILNDRKLNTNTKLSLAVLFFNNSETTVYAYNSEYE